MYENALIGAMPGMGKTFAVRVLALAAALDPTAELRVFELKGSGDLSALEKVAHTYGSGLDDQTIAACVDTLRQVVDEELPRRIKTIAGLPKDLCPENKVTPELAARRTLGLHPLVVVIDECQNLITHPIHGRTAGELCEKLIKLGRAFGLILILATQRPDASSLPPGVSANAGIRFCLRVMGQVENDMVLGTSMYKHGIRATTFTARDKGIGYLVGAADDPQIARSYYIDNPTAEKIAARARAARVAAGTLTGYAAGDTPEAESGPAVDLLTDLVAVMPADQPKVWSETLLARLAELRPQVYQDWTKEQLAAAVEPYGIRTTQVWGKDESGKGANRRGLVRDHVTQALAKRDTQRHQQGGDTPAPA